MPRGKLLNRWIILLCLATTVALSLACSSGSDFLDAVNIPSKDVFSDPIPYALRTSFTDIPGGTSVLGGEVTTFEDYDSSTESFFTNSFATADVQAIEDLFGDDSGAEEALVDRDDSIGESYSISTFKMMNTEVTVGMFVSFLNAVAKNSFELSSGTDGATSTFSDPTTIYKAIMQEEASCGVYRYEFGERQSDEITDTSSGAFISKTTAEGFSDPFVSIQQEKPRFMDGQQTNTFEVAPGRTHYPMVYVTQADAKEFCRWLGAQYRLPTWQEWQWAAAGGDFRYQFPTSTGQLYNTSNASLYANITYTSSSENSTLPVKSISGSRNAFGLYDMAGNVYEWTYHQSEDEAGAPNAPTYRFVLGGSYKTTEPLYATSWYRRLRGAESDWADDVGFRVVFDQNRGNSISDLE